MNQNFSQNYPGYPPTFPPPEPPKPAKRAHPFGVVALTLGIVAAVFCWIPLLHVLAFCCAGVALVFSIICLVKKRSVAQSVTALVLSFVALVLSVLLTLSLVDNPLGFLNFATDLNDDRYEGYTYDPYWGDYSLETPEDVLRLALEIDYGEYVNEDGGFLPVTLTNTSDFTQTYRLYFEAVDENGDRLAYDDTVYVTELAAGQSYTVDIFTNVSRTKREEMKTATVRLTYASTYVHSAEE